MKRIFFCFIVLLAFCHPVNSYTRPPKPAHNCENVQKESSSGPDEVQKSSNDYFDSELIEIADDDTNDQEDENVYSRPGASETFYVNSYDFFKLHSQITRNTGYCFYQRSPFFILYQVFRL